MEKQDSTGIQIQKKNLPLLYQLASRESAKAQRGYLWLVRSYIIFLIIGSAVLSFSTNNQELKLVH